MNTLQFKAATDDLVTVTSNPNSPTTISSDKIHITLSREQSSDFWSVVDGHIGETTIGPFTIRYESGNEITVIYEGTVYNNYDDYKLVLHFARMVGGFNDKTTLKYLLNNSDTAQTEVFGHLANNANCWKDAIIPAMLDEDVQKAIVKYFDAMGIDESSDEHLDLGLNDHHRELVEVVTNFIEGEDGNSEYSFDGYLYEIFMDLAKEFYVKKWYLLEETQQKLLEKVINSNTATHEVLGKVVGKSLTWKEFLVPLILDPIVQEKVVKFFGNNPEYLENNGSLDREQMILEELDYLLKEDYPRIDNRYEMNVHTADVFMSLAREFYLNNWYEVSTDDGDTVTVFLNRPEPILSENILHIEDTPPKTQRKSKVNKYSYDRKLLIEYLNDYFIQNHMVVLSQDFLKTKSEMVFLIRMNDFWQHHDRKKYSLKVIFGQDYVEIEDTEDHSPLRDNDFTGIEILIDKFLNENN